MTTTKPLPPLAYLKECFELSEDSPSGLVWKVRPREHFKDPATWNRVNKRFAGKPAGGIWFDKSRGRKYWIVEIIHKPFKNHRIVYSLFHELDLDPDIEIDHEDLNGLNNKIKNLRPATSSSNKQNQPLRKDNSSGYKGVFYRKDTGNYRGEVVHQGKKYITGYSPCPKIINQMCIELREKLHKEFCNHGN